MNSDRGFISIYWYSMVLNQYHNDQETIHYLPLDPTTSPTNPTLIGSYSLRTLEIQTTRGKPDNGGNFLWR
jgi:hypothetical protein